MSDAPIAGNDAGEFRVVAREGFNDLRVYHEPCKATLLVTQNVGVHMLVWLAQTHTCVTSPERSGG